MTVLYTNNAATTLAASISDTATSFSVASGTGSLFPAPVGLQWFYLTLVDSGGNLEIVKVTERTDDTMTVERAQDGTTALAFTAGSKVELRITKAMLDQLKLDANSISALTSMDATWLGISAYAPDTGVAVGSNALASANGIAVGHYAVAQPGDGSIAIGASAVSQAANAIALGKTTNASGENAIAIGEGSQVQGGAGYGIAIGFNAVVDYNATNSIAIGNGASAPSINTLVINPDPDSGAISPTHPGVYIGGIKDPAAAHTNIGILKYDIDTKEVYYFPEEPTTPALLGSTVGTATALGDGATATTALSLSIGNSAAIEQSLIIGYNNTPSTNSTLIGSYIDASQVTERLTVIGSDFPNPFTQGGLYASDVRDSSHGQDSYSKTLVYYDPSTREIYRSQNKAPSIDTLDGICAVGEVTTSVFTSVAVGGLAAARFSGGIAIGYGAVTADDKTQTNDGTPLDTYSIAIGYATSAGKNSVIVGGHTLADMYDNVTAVGNNVVVGSNDVVALNAAQNMFQVSTPGFYVQPVRGTTGVDRSGWGGTAYTLKYFPGIGEIFYDEAGGGSLIGLTEAVGVGAVSLGFAASASATMSTAIGSSSNVSAQYSVAVGGNSRAFENEAVAIGTNASVSATGSIAIGYGSATNVSATNSIAIGRFANASDTAANSIVIGADTAAPNPNTIILNAQSEFFVAYDSGFYVKPIRDNSHSQTAAGTLQYDSTTGEIFYAAGGGGGGSLSGTTTPWDQNTNAGGYTALGSNIGNVSGAPNTAVAIGSNAFSGSGNSVVVGHFASGGIEGTIEWWNVTAVGAYAAAQASGTAIGYQSNAGMSATAVGSNAMATQGASAFGPDAVATATGAVAVGVNIQASGENSVAVGSQTSASGMSAIAIGTLAAASGEKAVAIGTNASADGVNSISIGSAGTTAANIIAISAESSILNPSTTGLFIKPVRDSSNSQTSAGTLQYDSTTGEVYYSDAFRAVNDNLILKPNANASRTIGFSSGTNTTLVLQGGGSTGTGANLELTYDYLAYLDAATTKIRSNDGATTYATFASTGVTINTGNLTAANGYKLNTWTITESDGVLYFAVGGTNKAKLDSSGNFTVVGNVTAYGTV